MKSFELGIRSISIPVRDLRVGMILADDEYRPNYPPIAALEMTEDEVIVTLERAIRSRWESGLHDKVHFNIKHHAVIDLPSAFLNGNLRDD